MAQWTIFYDDGTTFSSEEGSPVDSPDKGVVCIACKTQACTVHKFDWYYWHEKHQCWWGSDIHGLLYQLRNDKTWNIRAVRTGANVTYDFLQDCMQRAFEARK
jgi:hypothetical protein